MRRGAKVNVWAVVVMGAATLVALGDRWSASAEFYVGEYKTLTGNRAAAIAAAADDDQETNEIANFQSRRLKVDNRHRAAAISSSKRRAVADGRSIGFSTFRPLTPGGTIYLAFVFLVPLTLGKTARRRSGWRQWPAEWAERLLERVRTEQQSLYDEMGYVDGNLMVRRALYELRDSFVRKLNPWRRSKNAKHKKKNKWKW